MRGRLFQEFFPIVCNPGFEKLNGLWIDIINYSNLSGVDAFIKDGVGDLIQDEAKKKLELVSWEWRLCPGGECKIRKKKQ
ncbi:hypothetical protein PanWU01x14_285310 [Parasponia andersonii]|uniref:Uncharacterized protein n=1 Tax=Parasponia andersonii TaxID=3476 RepID=A0A2P5AZN4_PARAD|nr:hypothetical protein PanWU01x14_285310 [Parasponia andersonii]